MLRNIYGPEREEVTGDRENCTGRNIIVYILYQILSGLLNEGG
jgi:hypothetical protein